MAERHVKMVHDLLLEKDAKKKKLYKRIKKYEDITDRIEAEITEYLTKVSTKQLSDESSEIVRIMLSIINDLERVGDICYQMSVSIERKEEQKIWFSAEQRKQLFELFDMVEKALEETTINLNNEYSKIDIGKAYNRERISTRKGIKFVKPFSKY